MRSVRPRLQPESALSVLYYIIVRRHWAGVHYIPPCRVLLVIKPPCFCSRPDRLPSALAEGIRASRFSMYLYIAYGGLAGVFYFITLY